jgi:hypothetical protein
MAPTSNKRKADAFDDTGRKRQATDDVRSSSRGDGVVGGREQYWMVQWYFKI